MAIQGQETIQIGAQNNPTGSDSLWTAFNKTQNNFVRLFTASSPYNNFVGEDGTLVSSNAQTGIVSIKNTGVLNLYPGTGITMTGSNGNIVISSSGGSGGGGGVTSIGINSGTLNVTNTPVISTGSIIIDLPVQPGVAAGQYSAPTLDIDRYGRIVGVTSSISAGTVSRVGLEGGSGIEIAGGPIVTAGTIRVTNTGVTKINAGAGIAVSSNTGEITVSLIEGSSVVPAAGGSGEVQFNLGDTLFSSPNFHFDNNDSILTVDNSNTVTTTVEQFLKLNPTTTPSSPTAGMIYYDSGMNKLRLYNGTSWGNISVT
jgi:hypothetical protein